MNNLILQNKSSLKNEKHPFHIFTPSYRPFIVALVAGMFVATFVFLMPFLNINNIKKIVYINSNLFDVYFENYAVMLSQMFLNDSDSALLYLTLEYFSKSYFNYNVIGITTVLSKYIFYGSFYIICAFVVFCQWCILFSLPYISISRLNLLKWFISINSTIFILTLINIIYHLYGCETEHIPLNNVKFDLIVDSLMNSWSIRTYEVWFSVLLIFSSRIANCSIWFFMFMWLKTLKNWSIIEDKKIINRWKKSMEIRIEQQPKFLLITMFISTFFLPYVFSFLDNFIMKFLCVVNITIGFVLIFLINLFGFNSMYFIFKKFFVVFVSGDFDKVILYLKNHPLKATIVSTGAAWSLWKSYDFIWDNPGVKVCKKVVKYLAEDKLEDTTKPDNFSSSKGIQMDQVDKEKVKNIAKRVSELRNKDNQLELSVKSGYLDIKETRK